MCVFCLHKDTTTDVKPAVIIIIIDSKSQFKIGTFAYIFLIITLVLLLLKPQIIVHDIQAVICQQVLLIVFSASSLHLCIKMCTD